MKLTFGARQQEIRLSFEQPQEGRAIVVIENEKGKRVRNLVSGRAFTAGKVPKSRREGWQAKISGNRSRDKRVESKLRAMGWHVVTIWACTLKNIHAKMWLESRIPSLIDGQEQEKGNPKVAEEETPYRA
jgi:hypothetical protein